MVTVANSHITSAFQARYSHQVAEMDVDDERPKMSAEADRELTKLWRTWRTVLEMLVDRVNYHVLKNCSFSGARLIRTR